MYKMPERIEQLIDELYESANLTNKKKIDELKRTMFAAMIPAEQGGEMRVESMVASKTKNPMVIFSWGSNRGELSPIQARQYCFQILEAAEAAVQDAALYHGVMQKLGGDENTAFGLITLVRETRRKYED